MRAITAVMLIVGGFMAVSLGLWNGCLGRRASSVANVPVSLPSEFSGSSGNHVERETSVARASVGPLMAGAPHASGLGFNAIRMAGTRPGRGTIGHGVRKATMAARGEAAVAASKADQVAPAGGIENGLSIDETHTVNRSELQPRNRP